MDIVFKSIGIIHSPFHDLADMPIQPTSDASGPGIVEVLPELAAALQDLEGFSHIYLLYYLHKVSESRLTVTPFLDNQPRGVFATRAPSRPNPLGLSLVELVHVEGNLLHVRGLDVLDGTPLLDIKPYVPAFEPTGEVRTGWLEQARDRVRNQRSDDRFG